MAATTQVRLLVWSCGWATVPPGPWPPWAPIITSAEAGRSCAPAWAAVPAARPVLAQACLCILHSSPTTSSSGQDVALWPRQPRFDSWCGHVAGPRCPLALGTHAPPSSPLLKPAAAALQLELLSPQLVRCSLKAVYASCIHHRPHRLVARTSRCGRGNPGSTPGVVMWLGQGAPWPLSPMRTHHHLW